MACDLGTRDPQALARLFDIDEQQQSHWKHTELGEILLHQLSAPLLFDLSNVHSADSGTIDKIDTLDLDSDQPTSFGDLFNHPAPSKSLLKLVKEFAKASDQRDNCPLPPEISTVLYYAAILSARLRLGERISTLSEDSLRNGILWALAQPWLGPLRQLFTDGLKVLSDTDSNSTERD